MRSQNEKIVRLFLPVAIGAGCMFALASAVNAVTELTGQSPRVGDIVAFTASGGRPDPAGLRLTVRRQGQPDCTLNLNMLQSFGGSFVIESEVAATPGAFVVHWAGSRTTEGSDDCSRDADLLMPAPDLNAVAIAAGGYGAGKKRLPVFGQEVGVTTGYSVESRIGRTAP